MSAQELMSRLVIFSKTGEAFDLREMREEILATHANAPTVADRVSCIRMFNLLMDEIERGVQPENLTDFREARS